ncbi:hypothetical protein DENSPDRAFT_781882 [Dentipellis sp. KUC8613]|nr:hypothetical protein DENSPDRAFT_781882 [Dentipellis sp. KUC8613]
MSTFQFIHETPGTPRPTGHILPSPGSPSPMQQHGRSPGPRSYTPRRNLAQKIDHILEALHETRLSLGEFLFHLFSNTIEVPSTGVTFARSERHKQLVAIFLSGRGGYTLSHVIEQIYRNTDSRPPHDHADAARAFSTTHRPTDIGYGQPALTTWALQIVVDKIIKESNYLQSDKAGLRVRASRKDGIKGRTKDPIASWDIISNFTFNGLQKTYEMFSPVTWHLLSKFMQPKVISSQRKTTYRPKHLVGISIMSELVYARNPWANLLALCRGLSLFASKAHQSLHRVGSRLAQCTPYSTTRRALYQMAKGKREALRRLYAGPDPVRHIVVADNVQATARLRDYRIGRGGTRMIIGTGATAVEMEDCPLGAFDLEPLLAKRAEGKRKTITVEDIHASKDWSHLRKVSALHWLNALVFFVPALTAYQTDVAQLFAEDVKKHQINPHRHSTIHPLGTNSANETTTHGMKDALMDFLKQLGIDEETFDNKLFFFTGDGKTFEGVNKIKRYLGSQPGNFKSLRFVVAGLELWHTKWTDLSRICSGKWGAAYPNDPSTLDHFARAIGIPKPSDLKKVDFYTYARLIEIVVRAHILHCWEYVYEHDGLPEFFDRLARTGDLPTIDELLAIAQLLSDRYSTHRAYEQALVGPVDDQGSPSADVEMSTPTAPSDDNDHSGAEHTRQTNSEAASGPIFRGDWALANSIILVRDGIWFLEACHAIAGGDIGRAWEILKLWIFTFAGAGNTNYTSYVLELWCSIELEFPEPTKIALFNNWLVNLTGKPGRFHPLDLMQEHFNFWLEDLAQHKGKEFDDDWYREVLSMHVHHFLHLKEEMEDLVQIAPRTKKHSAPHLMNEYIEALRICRENELHTHHEGRDFGHHSLDDYSRGFESLGLGGKLNDFIVSSTRDWDNEDAEITLPVDAADASTYMHAPMTYIDGQLVIPGLDIDI